MNLKILKPKKALNKAYLKIKPHRSDIEHFKDHLITLLNSIQENETEEFHKNLVIDFLKKTHYGSDYFINTKGRNDLVIHNGKTSKTNVGVIIEAKSPTNKYEMITTENLNKKAFQELVLYYLRERITHKNIEIKQLIATNIYEWFIFDAQTFDRLFAQNKNLVKQFQDFEAGRLAETKTDFFYSEIAATCINQIQTEITFTYFDVREFEEPLRNESKKDDNKLIALFKLLSPEHLLKLPFANDSNSLDKAFYGELLHIIGLTETIQSGKKLIQRPQIKNRNSGTLLESIIIQLDSLDVVDRMQQADQYGKNKEERHFNVALELAITWINRILFLKLMEAQLIKYNKDTSYSFLNLKKIKNYDDLNTLFFQVLAKKENERNADVAADFKNVPYLNSSLFEPADIERNATIYISGLRDEIEIPIYPKTVLKDESGKRKVGKLSALPYLFEFLNAYDFSSEGSEEIQEENKTLINASVLGLIFEKINGYKDGSFFTPGFITMYMARESIRKAALQKFNEVKAWDCTNTQELYNKIEDIQEANEIVNSIKICDPAVGSGHFLVSSLNEMIALKNDLKILQDRNGRRLKEYQVEVVNDELIVTDEDGELFEYNPNNKESQRIQETLFHEKQTIIEKCLFGVDINPNSVKICRLRLWIELLKNAYYKNATELETLPNIDINIKVGNSLISRFALDVDIKKALKNSKWTIDSYRLCVSAYHNAENKEQKHEMERLIKEIKSDFESEVSRNDNRIKNLSKYSGELYMLTQQQSLFEMTAKEKTAWNKKIKELTAKKEKLEAEIEEIKSNKIYENAFEWRFEFPQILNDDGDFIGFDVVIGNPPYIRIQGIRAIDSKLADAYVSKYKSATGSFDIYSLFVEKGIELIKDKGIVNYIMPVKWTNAAFGSGLRNVLLMDKAISKIINFNAFQAFDASTYTGLQWFEKKSENLLYYEVSEDCKTLNELGNYLNSLTEDKATFIPFGKLGKGTWTLTEGNVSKIIDKLNLQPRRISDFFEKIFQGLATSKDDVYFLYDCENEDNYVVGFSKQLNKEVTIEQKFVKPLLKGEDVHRYEKITTNRVVLFPYKVENGNAELYKENEIESQFPNAYAYLKECEDVLRDREKGRLKDDKLWYRYIYPKNLTLFEIEKLVAPEISLGGNFSYDQKGEFYSTTKVYGYIKKPEIRESYLFWLGLFNSQLFWYYIQQTGYVLRGGYFTFKTNYILPFPVPETLPIEIVSEIEKLVEDILLKKNSSEKMDTQIQQRMIDNFIYKLYDLSADEINIIENKSA